MRVVMGHSDDIDFPDALQSIIRQCQEALLGETPKAGLFFTSVLDIDYEPLLNAIMDAFPGIILTGCTTDGEISSQRQFLDDSLALLLFCGDELRFGGGIGQNISKNFQQAVLAAKQEAEQSLGSQGRLCLVFPDGISSTHIPFTEFLMDAFGPDFPVFGGSAGDGFYFKKTHQFLGRKAYTDAIPLLLIDGDILFSHEISSGWLPIGSRHTITSKNNVVHRIGDLSALDFYRHFLGTSSSYTQFPLAVFETTSGSPSERFYLRDPYEGNQQDGSLSFFGTFPDECLVQLTETGRSDLLQASADATRTALDDYPGVTPDVVLVFSCATRRQILGSKTNEEFECLTNLPEDIPFFGFCSYGELSPWNLQKTLHFQNDSYLILALGTR